MTLEAKVFNYTGLSVKYILDFAKTCNFYSSADQHSRCPTAITLIIITLILMENT